MARACRRALKNASVSLATCGGSDRSQSIRTQRFRTDDAGLMVAFPLTNGHSSIDGVTDACTLQELCFDGFHFSHFLNTFTP